MSVMVNFAMFPTDKGGSGTAPYVAKVLDELDKAGINYQLGPMGTTFEVETMEEAMSAITNAHNALQEVSDRIYCAVTIDSRKGMSNRTKQKVEDVEKLR